MVEKICTFTLGELSMGIQVDLVQEVIKHLTIERVPLAPFSVEGLINLRGHIITAVDLKRRFRFPEPMNAEPPKHVVVKTAEGLLSLLVDEIGDILEVSAEDFEPPPESLRGPTRPLVVGAYKRPEGFLLMLDLEEVSRMESTDADEFQ